MKKLLLSATILAFVASPAFATSLTSIQSGRNDAYFALQVGGKNTANINQSGKSDGVALVQVSGRSGNNASVTQSGSHDNAVVLQLP